MQQVITLANAVSLLNDEDKQYCEKEFKRYWDLSDILSNQKMFSLLKVNKLKEIDKDTFREGMQLMEKCNKQLTLNSQDLMTTFIKAIETYFMTKRKLSFTSLLKTLFMDPNTLKDITQLTSYDIVIFNILEQAGTQYFGPVL